MADTEHGRAVIRKVAWRLIPILGLCYFAAFLDRVNTGFAALTMSSDGSLIFLAAVCVVAAAVALLLGRTMRNLVTENPLLEALGKPRPDSDGGIAIPDRPGLGIDLSARQLQPWIVDHWSVKP